MGRGLDILGSQQDLPCRVRKPSVDPSSMGCHRKGRHGESRRPASVGEDLHLPRLCGDYPRQGREKMEIQLGCAIAAKISGHHGQRPPLTRIAPGSSYMSLVTPTELDSVIGRLR